MPCQQLFEDLKCYIKGEGTLARFSNCRTKSVLLSPSFLSLPSLYPCPRWAVIWGRTRSLFRDPNIQTLKSTEDLPSSSGTLFSNQPGLTLPHFFKFSSGWTPLFPFPYLQWQPSGWFSHFSCLFFKRLARQAYFPLQWPFIFQAQPSENETIVVTENIIH